MTVEQLRRQLKEHRRRENLSFEQVAYGIGIDRISHRTVRRFEKGEVVPHEQTIYDIEQYLKRQKAQKHEAVA